MKHIIVRSCRDCPYFVDWAPDAKLWWCEAMKKNNIVQRIEDPDTIPDWCPLPDYKEEK